MLTNRTGRDQSHQHQNDHVEARGDQVFQGIVTVTSTITEPSAIVWVNKAGNIVSTEKRGPHATSVPTSAPKVGGNIGPANPAGAPGPFDEVGPPSYGEGSAQPPAPASPSTPLSAAPTPSSEANTNTESSAAVGNGGYGICYDMIAGNGQCKTDTQVDSDFSFLAGQGFKMVRSYDIGCNMGLVVSKAAAHGMKAFVGINSVSNVAGDLGKLISMINGNWGPVDTINIGNEQVNQGVAPSVVIAAINSGRAILRAAGYNGAVVTSEVFNSWSTELASASDYIAANAHGFFDTSCAAANDGTWLENTYNQLNGLVQGKKVVISESGWPSAGQAAPNSKAIPSEANQQTAIAALKTAFANKPDSLYLFQAYDATYKQPGAMGIETSFGIYGTD